MTKRRDFKQTKYRSQSVVIDGRSFASRKEGRRYTELKLMERAGIIEDLRCQVPYPLEVNGVLVCTYVADFVYREKGNEVVEDTKSAFTGTLPVYRLKKKLMAAVHGIEIVES